MNGKAATLNNMAGVIAQQGDIDRALGLWAESLEIVTTQAAEEEKSDRP